MESVNESDEQSHSICKTMKVHQKTIYVEPKGKYFDKETQFKQKKKKELKIRKIQKSKHSLINIDYHSLSPLKSKSGSFPEIEIFISIENFKINEKIIAVIRKVGTFKKIVTEPIYPNQVKFKTTMKFEFIFEKDQKITINFWTESQLFLGRVQFTLGQLVGSLYNKLILDLNDGELGLKTDSCDSDEDLERRRNIARTIILFEKIKPFKHKKDQEEYLKKFLDFLRGNLKMQVIAAIDFTASNQHTLSGESLHQLYEHKLNEYQSAIASVSQVLLNYDYDQEIQVYGFGAEPLTSGFDHLLPLFKETDESLKKAIDSFHEYSELVKRRSRNSLQSRSRSGSKGSKGSESKIRRRKKRKGTGHGILHKTNKEDLEKVYEIAKKKERKHYQVSHFFPLTGCWRDTSGKGIDGVFEIYTNLLKKKRVKMGGPTLFAPMITEVNRIASDSFQADNYCYTILLILTDGVIHDMDETIEQLIDSSQLPISVIIVGLGYEDFTYMKILDSDHCSLKDNLGRKSKRDIVQFVDYSQFNQDEKSFKKLPLEVLNEIPEQVCSFYKMMNIEPKEPVKEVTKLLQHFIKDKDCDENVESKENLHEMTGNLSRKSGYLGKNKRKRYVYTKIKTLKKKQVEEDDFESESDQEDDKDGSCGFELEMKSFKDVKSQKSTNSELLMTVPDDDCGLTGKIKNISSNGLISHLNEIYH